MGKDHCRWHYIILNKLPRTYISESFQEGSKQISERAEGAKGNEVKISRGTRSTSSFELQPRELKGADRWPRESEQEDHGWRWHPKCHLKWLHQLKTKMNRGTDMLQKVWRVGKSLPQVAVLKPLLSWWINIRLRDRSERMDGCSVGSGWFLPTLVAHEWATGALCYPIIL